MIFISIVHLKSTNFLYLGHVPTDLESKECDTADLVLRIQKCGMVTFSALCIITFCLSASSKTSAKDAKFFTKAKCLLQMPRCSCKSYGVNSLKTHFCLNVILKACGKQAFNVYFKTENSLHSIYY